MSSQISLFIKRAEEYQTEEFIAKMFKSNEIGKVSNVKFIQKQNNGMNYNGAIVNFEEWNDNKSVKKLLYDMSCSIDGTTKFYFNSRNYWILKVHTLHHTLPKDKDINNDIDEITDKLNNLTNRETIQEEEILEQNLDKIHWDQLSHNPNAIQLLEQISDKDKIAKLEAQVRSLSAQLYYSTSMIEKYERKLMEQEQKDMNNQLQNIGLKCQLEEKDIEIHWLKEELENTLN